MTPALLKYHRVVWFSLAIILPVFYIAAIISIPATVVNRETGIVNPEPLVDVERTQSSNAFIVSLRTDTAREKFQLELVMRKPLSNPEAIVYAAYKASENVSKRVFLGKLSSRGLYRFSLGEDAATGAYIIEIFDPIKDMVIESIAL